VRLHVEDVSFGWRPGEPVLSEVSMTLEPGALTMVIGPNGAGKSTLLELGAGVRAPERGRVLLGDRPLAAWDALSLARELAVVFQREVVPFPFTVRELVTLGRYPRSASGLAWRRADHDRVDALLSRFDLEALAERPFDALSGGEQKRVVIARAMAQEPRVLLLDEPAAALDPRHQIAIMEHLAELASGGMSVCVVAHDLNLVAQFADRVVLLEAGRVRADGAPAEVLRHDVLEAVFQVGLYIGVNELTGALHVHPMKRSG
jgi:iron complex transport system ATP-binding protein